MILFIQAFLVHKNTYPEMGDVKIFKRGKLVEILLAFGVFEMVVEIACIVFILT